MAVTVENCTHIQISTLQKAIKKLVDQYYPESNPEELHQRVLDELNKVEVNGQKFEYTSQPNYLGGYRWFFLCPKCGTRASKLFLPPITAKTRDQKYYCKGCHRLKNQSAIMGQNKIYQKVTRPLKRMKDIEDRLARGYIKDDKVQDLLTEYELLESQMKASPEYRLFSFKKKHNLL